MTKQFRAVPIRISLDESNKQGRVPTKVQILKTGTYYSDVYGKFEITPTMLSSMKKNFDDKVRGIDLAIDYSHENQDVAAGWIKELELNEDGKELWAVVDWTQPAEEKLLHKQFRYLSAEFINDYKDNETLKNHGPTLFGAGLTNRPVIKNMAPVIELHETKLADTEQDKLKEALQERSKKYGIEVADDAHLTPPAGQPTDESDYADPVNYKYPVGDSAHAANARARFIQAQDSYKDQKSKNIVYERIVRKELEFGITPSFDSKNPLDESLPSEIKEKLQKGKEENKMGENDLSKMSPEDMIKMIKDLQAQVAEMCAEKEKQAAAQKLAEKEAKFTKLLSEGKAVPAQKEAYMSGDAEKFAELAQKLHETAIGHGQTQSGETKYELSEDEKKICKSLGLTEDEYRKANNL